MGAEQIMADGWCQPLQEPVPGRIFTFDIFKATSPRCLRHNRV